jgi:hypothetical protein
MTIGPAVAAGCTGAAVGATVAVGWAVQAAVPMSSTNKTKLNILLRIFSPLEIVIFYLETNLVIFSCLPG